MFRSTTLATILTTATLLATASTGLAARTETSGKGSLIGKTPAPVASIPAARLRKAIALADVNHDKRVTTQDMYDFMEAWNIGLEKGTANMQDYYNFLEAWNLATSVK